MSLYEVRCCKQCIAIKAYGKLLGIKNDVDMTRRWIMWGHAERWCNDWKRDNNNDQIK